MSKSDLTQSQEVSITKTTQITAFTPEEELKYLVERGDWELVLSSEAFKKRSPEGQAQVVSTALDNRIAQLGKTVNLLVNRGPDYRASAMGVIQRKQELEKIRDEILKKIYEQFPKTLTDKPGEKIDFY